MAQRRYRRSGSPIRGSYDMVAPMRSSTGTLEYPYHDRYYPPSRVSHAVRTSPRSSADRFPDAQLQPPPPRAAYHGDRSSSTRYPATYPRPRRATLESDQRRPVIIPSSRPAPPTSRALVRPADSEPDDDYYIYPSTSARRAHQRNVSLDQAGPDRVLGYGARPDPQRERDRVPEGAGYRGHERRKVYHYGGAALAPPEDDRARYDSDGYHPSHRRSVAREDPYMPLSPGRRRADSVDTGRRVPMDMAALRQSLPRATEPRARMDRGPERLSMPPPIGQGPPRPLYDSPVDLREARFEAEDPRRHRRKSVLLHQDDGGARPHHGSHHQDPGHDYDRGHRSREHADDHDRRVPGGAAATAAAAAAAGQHHRSSRARDPSPDYNDGSSSDDEHRRRSHRHHRRDKHDKHDKHDKQYHHHRHADDRARHGTQDERATEAAPARAVAEYDPPERYSRDRPGSVHEIVARPPPDELRQQEYVERESRAREEEERQRNRRDVLPQEPRGPDSPDHEGSSRAPDQREPRSTERSPRNDERSSQVRVVSPPRSKEVKAPLKGILREPREKFPEDPAPVREGVAPLKEALKDGRKGIPPGARWTKIDRRRVNPAALEEAQERFEERPDHVIVLRVLTREEIEALALRTQQIRGASL